MAQHQIHNAGKWPSQNLSEFCAQVVRLIFNNAKTIVSLLKKQTVNKSHVAA